MHRLPLPPRFDSLPACEGDAAFAARVGRRRRRAALPPVPVPSPLPAWWWEWCRVHGDAHPRKLPPPAWVAAWDRRAARDAAKDAARYAAHYAAR